MVELSFSSYIKSILLLLNVLISNFLVMIYCEAY